MTFPALGVTTPVFVTASRSPSLICSASSGDEYNGGSGPIRAPDSLVQQTVSASLFEPSSGVTIRCDGPVRKYLVGPEGQRISDSFMRFRLFLADKGTVRIQFLIGKRAAANWALHIKTNPLRVVTSDEYFMGFNYREDLGVLLGHIGVSNWIVDPSTGGRAHQKGYAYIKREGGGFYGRQTGASSEWEPIAFNENVVIDNMLISERPLPQLGSDNKM